MPTPTIRPKAVCVCRDGDRILVERGHDRVTQERFYRAIGGAIEFGERAADAVRREWLEEVRAELDDLELLGVLENLFTYEGRAGHELVFVFSARLRGAFPRSDVPVEVVEPGGQRHVIEWVSVVELEKNGVTIYPAGLVDLLHDEAV
jgi:8-oxo-dGTP pyrophosphatase MutT (NUDIX family)